MTSDSFDREQCRRRILARRARFVAAALAGAGLGAAVQSCAAAQPETCLTPERWPTTGTTSAAEEAPLTGPDAGALDGGPGAAAARVEPDAGAAVPPEPMVCLEMVRPDSPRPCLSPPPPRPCLR
ncbi:MAG: hypothetical protein HY744_07560 [Deltaproteobacteria bacterium]|nr:hypothetical protein [Deltaproteobacteria bacterium]